MISVCLATYNGAKYLKEQVDSILNQLSENDELVVSDDGSKDDTVSILESYHDYRIKILKNLNNHGVVGNFENAIINSKGDIIFCADQDDVWLDDKVSCCLELLSNNDLIVHNAILVDGDLNPIGQDFFSLRNSRGGYWRNLYRNCFVGCCMCFKRELLKYALPFPKSILWHDMWIGIIAEKRGKVLFSDKSLIYFRRHGNNTSQTASKSNFSLFKKLSYRFTMFFNSLFR